MLNKRMFRETRRLAPALQRSSAPIERAARTTSMTSMTAAAQLNDEVLDVSRSTVDKPVPSISELKQFTRIAL
jgi:hypothetical protein